MVETFTYRKIIRENFVSIQRRWSDTDTGMWLKMLQAKNQHAILHAEL